MVQTNDSFPFTLEHVVAWVMKLKDGTVVRFNLIDSAEKAAGKKVQASNWKQATKASSTSYHFSSWCEEHAPDPAKPALFEADGIRIYIANASGARKMAKLFDVAIDGGSVLDVPGEHDLPILFGDPGLSRKLTKHIARPTVKVEGGVKILKIRWFDRCAPPVFASFWPALAEELKALQKKKGEPLNVVTICQGGHGRSGSAAAALMMCLSEYTPLDALTHIRALHCARAIESKDQHVYLNVVADELGREQNALAAEGVKSFKDAFLAGTFGEEYKSRLRSGLGATITEREGSYL